MKRVRISVDRSRRRTIGLEITSASFAAAQWDERQLRLRTTAILTRATKPGADPTPVAEEWERLVGVLERRGFDGRDVVLTMPESRLQTAVLELPPKRSGAPVAQIAAAEMARLTRKDAGALQTRMWELPQPVRAGASDAMHAMVVASETRDVLALVSGAEQVGLRVAAVDARCCALGRACGRAVARDGRIDQRYALAIDLSHSAALLVALRSEGTAGQTSGSASDLPQIVYEREIRDVSVDRLMARIREIHGCTAEEAELVIRAGLDADSPWADLVTTEVATAFREQAELVSTELEAAAGFMAHRYPCELASIELCGVGACVPGFVAAITGRLERQQVCSRGLTPGGEVTGLGGIDDPRLVIAAGAALHPVEGQP